MNILLINHYAGSVTLGRELRPYYLAKHWKSSGHRVTIITADYSHLRQRNPYIDHSMEERFVDGVRYCFIKTVRYSGSGAGRIFSILRFVNFLFLHADDLVKRYRPDVVIASSTYPFDAYPAAKIADISGAKLIFEIHDLWPLTQIMLYGYNPQHFLIRLTQKAEDYAFLKSDGIVSILPYGDRYISDMGYPLKHYRYIPNGVDFTEEASDEKLKSFTGIEELKLRKANGNFVVLYAGGFARSNALETFLETARISPPGNLFAMVGNGEEKIHIKKMAQKAGLRNLMLLRAVPHAQLREVLSLADCLYAGIKKSGLYRYGIGLNKLYEYMGAGRPIIFSADIEGDWVSKAGCIVKVPTEDPDAILGAIQTLRSMAPEERKKMGLRGMEYVRKEHDYRELAENFIKLIEEC